MIKINYYELSEETDKEFATLLKKIRNKNNKRKL